MKKSSMRNFMLSAMLVISILDSFPVQGQVLSDSTRRIEAADAFKLIENGEHAKLVELLSSKVDPSLQNNEGVCLLLTAWQTRQRRAFDILLEFGADLHQTLPQDVTIKVNDQELMLQSGSSVAFNAMKYAYLRPEFVELALRYLKCPNQRNRQQETILHTFISSHRIRLDKTHKELLNNPLQYKAGRIVFILILNAGVDINAMDGDGKTALNLIVPREPASSENLQHFKERPDWIIADGSIARSGSFLLERGANPYLKSMDGSCFVDELRRLGDSYEGFKSSQRLVFVLDSKEELHSPVKMPRTEEDPSITKLLTFRMFEEDANNEINVAIDGLIHFPFDLKPGVSPLLSVGDSRAFDELVRIGFNPNTTGFGGFSFLLSALLTAQAANFEQLIQMGANPDVKLTENLWDCARSSGLLEEDVKLRALSGYQFWPDKGDTVMMAACLNPFRRKQFIEPALSATREPNQRDELGRNLLHLLLYHPLLEGQEIFVEKLIQAGVDVNARTISGATPSHVAVGMNPGTILTLVMAGADLRIRDVRDRTVLDLLNQAIAENWGSRDECKRVLHLLTLRESN